MGIEEHQRYVELVEGVTGEDDPFFVEVLLSFGDHLESRGRPLWALDVLERALDVGEGLSVREPVIRGIHATLEKAARAITEDEDRPEPDKERARAVLSRLAGEDR